MKVAREYLLVNRNIWVGQHRTSMRLEPVYWQSLKEICHRESYTLADLVTKIDGDAGGVDRTAAVRAFVLDYFRCATTDASHVAVGHGSLEALA